jgi:prolycopene isomerase
MGTGTPTVTTSGISAANAVLKKLNLEPFVYRKDMINVVRIVEHPFTADQLNANVDDRTREVMKKAMQCRFCENPTCTLDCDIRGIMRRVAVGNVIGAKRVWEKNPTDAKTLALYESECICSADNGSAVKIREVIQFIEG